jgi:hypothetical protein
MSSFCGDQADDMAAAAWQSASSDSPTIGRRDG